MPFLRESLAKGQKLVFFFFVGQGVLHQLLTPVDMKFESATVV